MADPQIIFDLDEMPYVEAIWFVAWQEADWMAVAWRDESGWRFRYRFRYYSGTKDPFDLTDTKNVYGCALKSGDEATRVKLHEAVDMIADLTRANYKGQKWKLLVQGDAARAMSLIAQQPWGHVKPLGTT